MSRLKRNSNESPDEDQPDNMADDSKDNLFEDSDSDSTITDATQDVKRRTITVQEWMFRNHPDRMYLVVAFHSFYSRNKDNFKTFEEAFKAFEGIGNTGSGE